MNRHIQLQRMPIHFMGKNWTSQTSQQFLSVTTAEAVALKAQLMVDGCVWNVLTKRPPFGLCSAIWDRSNGRRKRRDRHGQPNGNVHCAGDATDVAR